MTPMNDTSCVMSIERVSIQQKLNYSIIKRTQLSHWSNIIALLVLQGYDVGRPMTQPSRRLRYDAQS
jgi:hypothetical protein